MHASLQKLFDEIEVQRNNMLESVRHVSPERLTISPAPGKWSIAQILSHLIAAERISLLYIQKKIQGINEVEDTGPWEEVKMILLRFSQRLPGLKFKAPRKVIESTALYNDLPSIVKEWDQVRMDFKLLLEKIPDALIHRRIYRHIRAGYLNVGHAIQFFREHAIHHSLQIKRLAKQK